MDPPLLPPDQPTFFRGWNAVERCLLNNYQTDRKRRDDAAIAQALGPTGAEPSRPRKRSRRARDEDEDSDSSSGGRATGAEAKKARTEAKVKVLYSNYTALSGISAAGGKLDHTTMPGFDSVHKVFIGLQRVPPGFPGQGQKDFAYLFDSEGLVSKDNLGGFSSEDSVMYIFNRFCLELDTICLAMSVILNAESPKLKGFSGDANRDTTTLLDVEPAGAEVMVGALPQVVTAFQLKVRKILAQEGVSSYQANELCKRLLRSIREHICNNTCSLNVAIHEVKSQVNAFALAIEGFATHYRTEPRFRNERDRERDRDRKPPKTRSPCRNWKQGRCSKSQEECRYQHSGPSGSGAQRSQSRGRHSASRSNSNARSDGGAKKADAGFTPGGILRKKAKFDV